MVSDFPSLPCVKGIHLEDISCFGNNQAGTIATLSTVSTGEDKVSRVSRLRVDHWYLLNTI